MMYIKVEFSDDEIFGDYDGADIDRPASIAHFKEMLEGKLQFHYPDACIEIEHGLNDECYVETDNGRDPDEEKWINVHIDHVWEYYQWEVFAEVG